MFEVQNLIYVYIALCFAMMIFNWFYMMYNNSSKKKMQKRDKKLIKKIDLQLALIQSGYQVSAKHKKYLEEKLKKVSNLYIFEEALSIYEEEDILKYIEEIKIIFIGLCKIYEKKDSITKAYFAYIIGKYKITKNNRNEQITSYLFQMLEEESIYSVDNAMRAFYKLENLNDIMKAIKIIDKKANYNNIDVITKGLLTYEGNKEELAKKLWEEFENYKEKLKSAIIQYISEISDGNWNDQMYNLLKEQKQTQGVKIAIIKYFEKHYDPRIKEILFKILKTPGMKNIRTYSNSHKSIKIIPRR